MLCRSVGALGLHPCITALLQLAGMYALGVLVVLCAYAGFGVTASILEVRPAARMFLKSATGLPHSASCLPRPALHKGQAWEEHSQPLTLLSGEAAVAACIT